MKKHYVCSECGGVSDKPGVCQTPGCSHLGHQLVECNCIDGKHAEVLKKCEKCENCGQICKGSCAIEEFKPELTA